MSTKRPTIIVSGMARCGTSLTMQMLHACGLRCASEFPAFEAPETNTLECGDLQPEWLRSFEAVKVIDPHRAKFPLIDCRVIWLDRDPTAQARSQVKFVSLLTGISIAPGSVYGMRRSLIADRRIALGSFAGMPVHITSFEKAIGNPELFCSEIASFLRPEYLLNPTLMAACIVPRKDGARCEPSLDIEVSLMHREEFSEGVGRG